MKLSLNKAAKEFGIGKSTISKAISDGKLTAERNSAGGYRIDTSEILRVFGDLIEQRSGERSRSTKEPLETTEQVRVHDRTRTVQPNGVHDLRIELTEAVAQWKAAERLLEQANVRADREEANAENWRRQAETAQKLLIDQRKEEAEKPSRHGLFARLFGRAA